MLTCFDIIDFFFHGLHTVLIISEVFEHFSFLFIECVFHFFVMKSNVLFYMLSILMEGMLDILSETLPFLLLLASFYRRSHYQVPGEILRIVEIICWQLVFSFEYHVYFLLVLFYDCLLHDFLIRFRYHCNDEIHKYYRTYKHRSCPKHPCCPQQQLIGFLCKCVKFKVAQSCSKGHEKVTELS